MSVVPLLGSGPLPCIGRGGRVSTPYFEALCNPCNPDEWQFDVWRSATVKAAMLSGSHPPPLPQPFQLTLVTLDPGRVRVATIHANKQKWSEGMGIGSALLTTAARLLARTVVSSVLADPARDESRDETAEAMWCKMVSRNQAIYLSAEDRYQVTP
jgi:hypothetical protein